MSLPIYQRVAVTDAGDIIPGAEYTVINENTGVAAPIYSDRTGATLLTAPYFADSAGTIQFFIAQGTTFRVAASGGVGTYTDRYVYGVAEAVLVQADGDVDIDVLNVANINATSIINLSSTSYFTGNATHGYRFNNASNSSNLLVIKDTGNVGIGTSSPGARLAIESNLSYNNSAQFNHSGASNQYGIAINTTIDQNDGTRYFIGAVGGSTTRFRVLTNGNVQNSNNSYGGFSDQKLKENIADSASQWDDLKAVRLRNYSMISDEETSANRLGVIAQELEAAGMGGLVEESDDLDENNESLGTTTKSVKYSILYMKAVGALQEAQTRIESLEERITALEAK